MTENGIEDIYPLTALQQGFLWHWLAGTEAGLGIEQIGLVLQGPLRLEAYATVDEANAQLGVALATGGLDGDVVAVLTRVQNDLFDVGADLCTPVVPDPEFPPLRIEQDYVDRLEQWCDEYNEHLPRLRSFILNGGTPAAAHLHVARVVIRRAERAGWRAHEQYADTMNVLALTYLNRLSDLVFILARHANRDRGDVLWVPGGER